MTGLLHQPQLRLQTQLRLLSPHPWKWHLNAQTKPQSPNSPLGRWRGCSVALSTEQLCCRYISDSLTSWMALCYKRYQSVNATCQAVHDSYCCCFVRALILFGQMRLSVMSSWFLGTASKISSSTESSWLHPVTILRLCSPVSRPVLLGWKQTT